MRRPWVTVRVGVAGLCLAACASAQVDPGTARGDGDWSYLAPCPEQTAPSGLPHVPGLVLPEEAEVLSVYEVGPLTQAEGMVALTPVQARAYYESHEHLTVLTAEDERVEAEILVSDGSYRMFVKVQVACATGSRFTATVASESDAAAVPTPAGDIAPSTGS